MTQTLLDDAPQGARAITSDLLARLQRHYIKPGEQFPGGVFVPEVGWNVGGTRRADALYVGFTGSSGRLLVGHEIKASRADWLKELDTPGKADEWADECHAWYVVAAPGIVKTEELPHGWGLMLPGRSRTRMDVAVKAAVHAERCPSWNAVRSIMARLDTLRGQAIADARMAARDDAMKRVEDQVEMRLSQRLGHRETEEQLTAKLAAIEAALGRRINLSQDEGRLYRDELGREDLARIGQALTRCHDVDEALDLLVGRYGDARQLQRVREHLTELEKALESLRPAAATPTPDVPARTSPPAPSSNAHSRATNRPLSATTASPNHEPTRPHAAPQPAATQTQQPTMPGGAT